MPFDTIANKPQTFRQILDIYARIDSRTADWTACYMLDFGVVQGVKDNILKTRNPMFERSIY
tara:strand:+ start:4173 stop:4358 length:186 start_codon:yes stop_codon:yes gene_type:complete